MCVSAGEIRRGGWKKATAWIGPSVASVARSTVVTVLRILYWVYLSDVYVRTSASHDGLPPSPHINTISRVVECAAWGAGDPLSDTPSLTSEMNTFLSSQGA